MGSKSPDTVTQVNSPPPQILQQYQNVTNQANQVAQNPYVPYTGNLVANLTPEQNTGIGNINQASGVANPFINSARRLTNQGAANITPTQFSGDQVSQYMSPYQNSVIAATLAQINNQNQQQQQQLLGQGISAGAFGGDRTGVAQAALAGQQALATNSTLANLNNQNYAQALQEFNTQQQTSLAAQQNNAARQAQAAFTMGSLGTEAQNTALQGASAQLQAGALQQGTEQAKLTAAYQQFLNQQAYPFQTTGWLANISEGLGSQSGGTSETQTPGPSVAGQVAGLGLAGLGLYNAGAFSGLGSALSGLFSLSDERAKEDIEPIGKTFDGQTIYKYRFKDSDQVHVGLMAQEVEKKHPHAVADLGGLKGVDYDKATEESAHRGHFALGGTPYGGDNSSGQSGPYGSSYVPQINLPIGHTMPSAPAAPQDTSLQDAIKMGAEAGVFNKKPATGIAAPAAPTAPAANPNPPPVDNSQFNGLYAAGGTVRGYDDGGPVSAFARLGNPPDQDTNQLSDEHNQALFGTTKPTGMDLFHYLTGVVPTGRKGYDDGGLVGPALSRHDILFDPNSVPTSTLADVPVNTPPATTSKFLNGAQVTAPDDSAPTRLAPYKAPVNPPVAPVGGGSDPGASVADVPVPAARPAPAPEQKGPIDLGATPAAPASTLPNDGTLGAVNNNPGNIRALLPNGQVNPWVSKLPGFAGVSPKGFAMFDNISNGTEAMRANMRSYASQGIDTLNKLTAKWAPFGDGNNDPIAYAAQIGKETGIDPNAKIDLTDPNIVNKIIPIQARIEQGHPVNFGLNSGLAPVAPPKVVGYSPAGVAITDVGSNPSRPASQNDNQGISPANMALISAGLGMMASRSKWPLVAIGQGGLQGVNSYLQTLQANRQNDIAKADIAYKQGMLGIESRKQSLSEMSVNRMLDEANRVSKVLNPPVDENTGKPLKPVPTSTGATPAPAQPAAPAAPAGTTAVPAPAKAGTTQNEPAPAGATPTPAQPPTQTSQAQVGSKGTPPPAEPTEASSNSVQRPQLNPEFDPEYLNAQAQKYETAAKVALSYGDQKGAAELNANARSLRDRANQIVTSGKSQDNNGQVINLPGSVEAETNKEAAIATAKATAEGKVKPTNEILAKEPQMIDQYNARQVAKERLGELASLVEEYQTGNLADVKARAVGIARALGLKVPNDATANPAAFQEFIKNATANVFAQIKDIGGRPLVSEITGLMQSNANPELQPDANRNLLGQGLGLLNREDKLYNDYFDWRGNTAEGQNPTAIGYQKFSKAWNEKNHTADFVAAARHDIAPLGYEPAPNEREDKQSYMTADGKRYWHTTDPNTHAKLATPGYGPVVPKVGTTNKSNTLRYIGGDPSKKSSWQKVQEVE